MKHWHTFKIPNRDFEALTTAVSNANNNSENKRSLCGVSINFETPEETEVVLHYDDLHAMARVLIEFGKQQYLSSVWKPTHEKCLSAYFLFYIDGQRYKVMYNALPGECFYMESVMVYEESYTDKFKPVQGRHTDGQDITERGASIALRDYLNKTKPNDKKTAAGS